MKSMFKRTILLLLFTFVFVLVLGACGDTKIVSNQSTDSSTNSSTDSSTNSGDDSRKVTIKSISPNQTGYMIKSAEGTVIAADPSLIAQDFKPDIITSTHMHKDHNDDFFYSNHQDSKLSLYKAEKFTVKDINVFSILSSHLGDEIDKEMPSNVIYVYEIDGLRIAHMGDIGQEKLTDEQLKSLGKLDIAFMQFENSYSDYSVDNEKGFRLIEQLKPQIIIPTHSSEAATKKISDIVGKYKSVNNVLEISKNDLKDGVRKVIDIKYIIE